MSARIQGAGSSCIFSHQICILLLFMVPFLQKYAFIFIHIKYISHFANAIQYSISFIKGEIIDWWYSFGFVADILALCVICGHLRPKKLKHFYFKQECIPVGCVPPAAVAVREGSPPGTPNTPPPGRGTHPGKVICLQVCVCPRGGAWSRGVVVVVWSWGVWFWGGVPGPGAHFIFGR